MKFGQENYLKILDSDLKITLVKFRCGAHHLPISEQRYDQITIKNFCPFCPASVGDEYHYLLECPAMELERARYLDEFYSQNPTLYEFHKIMNMQNKAKLAKLCKFVKHIIYIFRP